MCVCVFIAWTFIFCLSPVSWTCSYLTAISRPGAPQQILKDRKRWDKLHLQDCSWIKVSIVEWSTSTSSVHIFMLPFQNCEHCPGKSSRISPWVQKVERPKYALHTQRKKRNFSVLIWIKAFLDCKYKHPTSVVHGVWEKVWTLRTQAESGYWVSMALHIVDQLVLPQIPHLQNKKFSIFN